MARGCERLCGGGSSCLAKEDGANRGGKRACVTLSTLPRGRSLCGAYAIGTRTAALRLSRMLCRGDRGFRILQAQGAQGERRRIRRWCWRGIWCEETVSRPNDKPCTSLCRQWQSTRAYGVGGRLGAYCSYVRSLRVTTHPVNARYQGGDSDGDHACAWSVSCFFTAGRSHTHPTKARCHGA